MKLKVLGRYRNEPLQVGFDKGMIVEVDDALAAVLMADSPESFEEYTEPVKTANKRVPTKDDK